jgi:hypothetical protein
MRRKLRFPPTYKNINRAVLLSSTTFNHTRRRNTLSGHEREVAGADTGGLFFARVFRLFDRENNPVVYICELQDAAVFGLVFSVFRAAQGYTTTRAAPRLTT